MSDKKHTPELLPSGFIQGLLFCVEEIRDHLRAGQLTTKRQIASANYLPAKERVAIMPGLTRQLEYYERSEGTLDYLLTRCKQRMKWPAIVRAMSDSELAESGIDSNLWECMGWTQARETQTA